MCGCGVAEVLLLGVDVRVQTVSDCAPAVAESCEAEHFECASIVTGNISSFLCCLYYDFETFLFLGTVVVVVVVLKHMEENTIYILIIAQFGG